jgi:O-methyltransferase
MPGIRFLSEQEQKSLPNPGETILETTGAVSVSLEDFINHLKNAGVYSDKIIPVRGWFEDTTAGIPKEHQMNPIQILRLDGDLYNSTLVCLQNLYPLLAKGGICIVDDFALPGCRQAVEDYFLPFMKDDPMFSMEYIKDKNSVVAFWYK